MSEDLTSTSEESALVRLFIAIAIDDAIREALVDVQSRLKRTRAHVSWVKPANIHLSMAFLGNHPREAIAELSALLDEVASSAPPFPLTVRSVGAFGGERSPRIIWAGTEESKPLMQLQASITEGLVTLGYEVDTRPFAAHLTLGRVRSSRGSKDLVKALNELREDDPAFGKQEVADVRLYQSVLSPQGPTYVPLHGALLRA